jgi:hypothetical protein
MHKNKVGKSEKILAFAQRQFSHHVSPRVHHVFTIKNHVQPPLFPKPPSKSPAKNAKIPPPPAQIFFEI